jgi:hypothetical protein
LLVSLIEQDKNTALPHVSGAVGGKAKTKSKETSGTAGVRQRLDVPPTGVGTRKLKLGPTWGVPPHISSTPMKPAFSGLIEISKTANMTAILASMCGYYRNWAGAAQRSLRNKKGNS